MAYLTNRLVTEDELKEILGISDTVDDGRLTLAADSATQTVQAYCDRHFVVETTATARVFTALTPWTLEVDDISSTSGLVIKTDEDGDGVFETTWSASDYQLEPLNGRQNGQPWPFTRIRAIDAREWPLEYGQAVIEVTAKWGWRTDDPTTSYLPTPVKQAAQIQAISIFKSVDAPLGIAGFGDIGIMRLRQAIHPVAAALLAPYRRDPVLVG